MKLQRRWLGGQAEVGKDRGDAYRKRYADAEDNIFFAPDLAHNYSTSAEPSSQMLPIQTLPVPISGYHP
jgi:hypothetical protein